MGRVQLKITPSLASIFNASDSDWLVLEPEIGEGATIGDLFANLASTYTDFRKVVFDTDKGKVSDQVIVVLNDSLVQFSNVTEARLNDGDSVILLPVYTGG